MMRSNVACVEELKSQVLCFQPEIETLQTLSEALTARIALLEINQGMVVQQTSRSDNTHNEDMEQDDSAPSCANSAASSNSFCMLTPSVTNVVVLKEEHQASIA